MTEHTVDGLVELASGLLELPSDTLRHTMDHTSFVALGGSSLLAVRLVGAAARQLSVELPLGGLLGPDPLLTTFGAAQSVTGSDAPHGPAPRVRPLLPGQAGMLQSEEFVGGTAYHLLFTAEVTGTGAKQCTVALGELVKRHESLRTVFTHPEDGDGVYGRRVLPDPPPFIRRQILRPAHGTDAVAQVHGQLAHSSQSLLRPFERPPVVFTVTEVARPGDLAVLVSILIHHSLADGWSVGLLFSELAEALAGRVPPRPAPSAEAALAEHERIRSGPDWEKQLSDRAGQLSAVPSVVELPSDLPRPARQDPAGHRLVSTLSPAAGTAWSRLAAETGTTTTTVMLAAWALVLGRRAGTPELLVGTPVIARSQPGLEQLVAPCARLVPVHCRLDDTANARDFLTAVSQALGEAVNHSAIPFEDLVDALGTAADRRHNPVVQFVLGVHDELVPDRLERDGVTLGLHEGHCGGSPFDATLFVQRAGEEPRVALEYATAVLTAQDAADLLDSLDTALTELAAGLDRPLAESRTVSTTQHGRLAAARSGPPVPAAGSDADICALFHASALAHPDGIAVRDEDGEVTYRDLRRLVGRQAAALTSAGVAQGDCVLIGVPRSTGEVVAVLAVLAVGAHYLSLDPGTPDQRLTEILRIAEPRAVLVATDDESTAFASRATRLASAAVVSVPVVGADCASDHFEGRAAPHTRPAPDGDRTAYLAFTSGSTGPPKGVRVPHRAVVRLVAPGPQCCVRCSPGDRVMRFAPLPFDASTLELFVPLAAGGTVDVHPRGLPSPADLAEFLTARGIAVLWLTAGLFRLAAEYAPEGFAGVRHVLTGGDVVPPEQVRRLLARFPGLRVTNGYGPTENTTFSTVLHLDDATQVSDPLPIGRPLAGSGAVVLDHSGRPVPPGGLGELYVTGQGLALDYAGAPEQTAAAFTQLPGDERAYRTGDLARLGGDGLYRYLGRRDRQVKIRGFRVELDEIRQALDRLAGVRDTVVVATGTDSETRRLVAGVVPEPGCLSGPEQWAVDLSRVLPSYAVPGLWSVADHIPLTRNGKVDTETLAAAAVPLGDLALSTGRRDAGDTQAAEPKPTAQPANAPGQAAELASVAWEKALGKSPAGLDSDFFAAGGDSLRFARMVAWLRKEHGVRIPIRELYTQPTPRRLAELIAPAFETDGTPQ